MKKTSRRTLRGEPFLKMCYSAQDSRQFAEFTPCYGIDITPHSLHPICKECKAQIDNVFEKGEHDD